VSCLEHYLRKEELENTEGYEPLLPGLDDEVKKTPSKNLKKKVNKIINMIHN
jgi:hypothetical protein